jgi:hypothetical protein
MINPDIFGYYTVGDFKTYRKLEAIEAHARTGIHPNWNFNDDVYSAVDWLVEPASSLEELYRQRAQQLRKDYDYLVLWYSGGADSDAVLNSFVNNNILLDEVFSFTNYAATGDKFDFCNGEIFNVVLPKMERLKETCPHTKFRLFDLSQPLVDYFSNTSVCQDWMYDLNTIAAGLNAAKQHFYNYVPEWQRLFDQGKRVAFVRGIDKPRLQQSPDGRYCFRFIDIFDNAVSAGQQSTNPPWLNPELFFWSPDVPLIVVKQAHVVKKFLRHALESSPWLTKQSNGLAFKHINDKKYWLTVEGLHQLIYPGWQPIPYQIKNPSPVLSQRENWFRKLPDTDLAVKNYKQGLEKRWSMVPDYWKNSSDMFNGYKGCVSKIYDLGF